MAKRYWLMKSEPDVFSIRHLKDKPGQREHWDGVRNYTARNNLQEMSVGDGILFYHSSAEVIGVAGLAEVVRAAYPDPSALDPASAYHDPKARPDKNPWVMVDVKFKREFKQVVTLAVLRATPGLEKMMVNRPGTRLSVQPVTPEEFAIVAKLAKS